MGTEALQTSRLANGEAENSIHNESFQIPRQDCKRRHGSNGTIATTYDEKCSDEHTEGISSRYATEDIDMNRQPDVVYKKSRVQKELTLQDMYNQDSLDDDDEDDSDWEPLQKHVEIMKWFCSNCTMVNLDYVVHCDICGEHKESGILRHGFFASPSSQDVLTDVELEVKGKYKDLHSGVSVYNSRTAVGFDERMLLHSEVEMKSHPHPERPDRLRAIAASLATAGIFPGRCYPISAREITGEELKMVHSLEHIEAVELSSQIHASYFTPDTYANEHSALAARLAAGLCADLASAILSGCAKNGFALVRPPGHHAGVRQAMGFCLHNNAAVAALAALAAGAKKVLIVDWDVHHGNGTQEIFEGNKSVLYISLHRHEGGRFYPGTGAATEVGIDGAEGYCVNVPWSRGGVGDNDYIFAFQNVVLPIASEFAPDFTIISAGFDAARGDPLGCCDVTPAGYAQMTHMLNALSGGKLLVILEGGYNLRSISSSATSVIKVLLGENAGCELDHCVPSKSGLQTVLEVLKIQMNFWPSLTSRFTNLDSQWEIYAAEYKRMLKRPKYFDQLAGAMKKTGHARAGPAWKRLTTAEAKKMAEEAAPPTAPSLSSMSRGSPLVTARPDSPPKRTRKRRRLFGAEEAELSREMEEEQVLSKKQFARKEKKALEGTSKKRKGAVILGVDDLGQDIRDATSHLVPAFNELAEAVPPEKILKYEDFSPEEVVSRLCSQMAKANYLAAKNKNLLLSLLSEGGQAQRLQNRFSEMEAELAKKELAAVGAHSINKSLRAAASLERKNAEDAKKYLEATQANIRVLKVEVCSAESKLRAKDEELTRVRDELKRREAELEAERDAIRLEGVEDCAEIIPMILPNLDMRPIHAAIRFCKGEISQEEFQRWLPHSLEEVMDPDLISIAPVPQALEEAMDHDLISIVPVPPALKERRPEAPIPALEATIVGASHVVNVEAVVHPLEAEPS